METLAMAPKPLDFLNRIPTVSELLEKQPVRALTDRWNRSTVAAGVRSFLDELRTDLRRRAADVPSIRELAERAAKYVVDLQQSTPQTVINATGRIIGAPWLGVPLAERALERLVVAGRDFPIAASATATAAAAPASEMTALICRLTGAQAAVAMHSYSGALWLTLAALASEREVIVSRAEVGEVDMAGPLPKLAAAARCVLRDVGTANRTVAADYEAAASPRTSVLLKLCSDEYRIVGETAAAELEELVALARDRELILISALGAAPITDPPVAIDWPRRTAKTTISTGADLVLLRGDGLVGGPSCGILAGQQDLIQRVTANPLFAAAQLDSLRCAALLGTLECYEGSSTGSQSLGLPPVWQVLATPIENLRNRAERIAPQLAQAPEIAVATAVETRSPIASAMTDGDGWPSYAVALAAANGNSQSLQQRLSHADQPVFGRIENDRVLLDLRTVMPRQDTALVQALCGGTASNKDTPPGDNSATPA
jgi:L-seryl-tRNA(Ser) seleniumtransferase